MSAAVHVKRGLQALVLLFAIAQTVAPLLHAHFADGSAGPSGVHIHLGLSVPFAANHHTVTTEIRDFEARVVSTPDAHVGDDVLRLLDLPAIDGAVVASCSGRTTEAERFVCVQPTAAQPFPKPLPLAPPASA
ncbi:MAG TPA: hypothetical protein PLZ79_02695 [Burkholderiales bacterium]|nr:hypothetical protein [Burkholderiales bacterium]